MINDIRKSEHKIQNLTKMELEKQPSQTEFKILSTSQGFNNYVNAKDGKNLLFVQRTQKTGYISYGWKSHYKDLYSMQGKRSVT